MPYPRVLVVNGEPFNSLSATGLTLSGLFHGWPKENIAQIYTADIQPDTTICSKSWRLTNKDLYFFSQFHRLLKRHKKASTRDIIGAVDAVSTGVQTGLDRKGSILRKATTPFLDLLEYQLSPGLLKELSDFRPDVIYSTLGNIRLLRLVDKLSKSLNVPVVPHFMDDWLTTYSVSGKSLFTLVHGVLMEKLTKRILARAPIGLSIGDAMAEEYSYRFKLPFKAFMNPVPQLMLSADQSCRKFLSPRIRLIYVGGMHLGRSENLMDIGHAIASLRHSGANAELIIYAPPHDIVKFGHLMEAIDGVSVCGTIRPDQVQGVLYQAHVAVHVESFSKRDSQYTRLSISTKIPQYFAAGLPVLAYGPSEVASCRYVSDCGCGMSVVESDQETLVATIQQLISSSELREQLGARAQDIARERHNSQTERARFMGVLADACAQSKSNK